MSKGGRILSMGLACIVFAAPCSRAEETSAQPANQRGDAAIVDAEKMSFDQRSKTFQCGGKASVAYKGSRLHADRLKFNTETKEAWAEGNVRLNRDNTEWVGPGAYYNFETRNFVAQEIRGFVDGVIVRADSIQQSDTNSYALGKSSLTTCDYEKPHYRMEATHGEVWPNDRVVLYNVTLRLGDVPVFWLPMVMWSLKDDQQPVSLSLGYTSRWGFFVLTGTHWYLNEDVRLTVHVDGRTNRGVGVGADLKYRTGENGTGLLRGYYINDADRYDDTDIASGKEIPWNRYRAQWQHKQTVGGDIAVTADINKLSDPDIIDDFFRREFRDNREPASVADVTKRGPNFTLSLLALPQLNDFFAVVERLPEAKLAVNRTRLGKTPFFYDGESSLGQYHNDAGDTGDTNWFGNAVRADTFHQILMPQTMFGWLSVVPRAGARATYYSRAPDGVGSIKEATRVVYDLGMETSFKLSRTWEDVRFQPLRIKGLRHIVEPFADYQWVPEPNKLPSELFQFDSIRSVTLASGRELSLTRWSPLGFPAFNTIDDIDRENTIRFGVRQKLQTRRRGNPWDLIELTGWTDWHAEQDAGQKDFSDFFGTLRLRPFEWFVVETGARYDMSDGELLELNTRTRLTDNDRWSVGVVTRYLEGDSNLVGLDFSYRLSRHWTLDVYQRVECEDGTWEEQEYRLRQETHDWYIDYGFRYRQQRQRDDEWSVFFAVTLKAFPGITLGGE